MIQASITNDYPVMKAYIHHDTPRIKGVINTATPIIKGVIQPKAPTMIGRIKRAIDHEPDPYYEVANESGGFTIIIGD